MAVIADNRSGIITVAVTTTPAAPAPTAVSIGAAEAAAVIRRSPSPVTTVVGVIPAAAPSEAPATPAPTEAEPAVPAVAVPRVITIPRIEPRVVIAHTRRIIVKAVYAVGIFAVAVFVGIVIVIIPLIRIFVCIVATVGILLVFHGAFIIIIIRALVIDFPRLRVIIIDIIAESYLPRGATCT